MAVYTPITEPELAAHLARYDLGLLKSLAPISDGVENTNYLLVTAQGKFILTLFEGRVTAADLPFCLGFMAHLGRKGLPVAAPVAASNGETVVILKNKPSAVTTFLSGAWPRDPSAADCAQMGATLARMHDAGRDFPMERANAMGLPEWKRLILACEAKADPGLAASLKEELSFLEKSLPRGGLPRGAVHADVFPDNVFLDNGKISGVIDFYFSCTDFFAYDLMLALNAWAFDSAGTPDKAKIAAFMKGYEETRGLEPEERKNLPLFGRAAALRIVATRLYDSLHPKPGALVTPKNPLAHARILDFHRASS